MGQIAWLLMQSPVHKHLFLADLEWLVLPPVQLKQFRIFRQKKVPVAFASWAFISEEVEQRLTSGVNKIKPGEWNSGDRLWLIDLVAPFGGAEDILRNLADKVFPGRQVKTLQPNPDGKGLKVVELKATTQT